MEQQQTTHNNEWLKKEITIGQAVGFAITILCIIGSNWISTQVAIAEIKAKQQSFEVMTIRMQDVSEKNQDKILNEIRELRSELKTKQDK